MELTVELLRVLLQVAVSDERGPVADLCVLAVAALRMPKESAAVFASAMATPFPVRAVPANTVPLSAALAGIARV